MKKILFFLLFFFPLWIEPAIGLERFDIISTEEMRQLVADRAARKVDFILVNSLDEMIFRDAFIPGSINIPLGRLHRMRDKLGEDRQKLVITYCMGYR